MTSFPVRASFHKEQAALRLHLRRSSGRTSIRTSICEGDIVNNDRAIDRSALVAVHTNLH
jgi:hypothetical protein